MPSMPINESLTLHFSDRSMRSLFAPLHALACAVLPAWRAEGAVDVVPSILADEGEFSIVFCLKTPRDEGGLDALVRAQKHVPDAQWRTLSGIACGRAPGVDTPYWEKTVTCHQDGMISLSQGNGLDSLDEVVRKMSQFMKSTKRV